MPPSQKCVNFQCSRLAVKRKIRYTSGLVFDNCTNTMPIIKTRHFQHKAKSGDVFEFKAPIKVDSKGEFSVEIPEELATSAQALLKQPIWAGHIKVEQARVHWHIKSRALDSLERFVEAAMAEHMAVVVTKELVIRYRYRNHTAGAKDAQGNIHPNGHWVDKPGSDQKNWEWAGNQNIHATNRPSLFGVGVVARVYMKVTYTRNGGSKVDYTNDLPGSHWDRNPMRRLNDFIVQAPDERDGFRSGDIMTSGKSPSDNIHEMPYSDEAASFFADLMVAMCRLGEQLDNFVGNRANLELAIERGATLLPAPAKT